MNKIHLLAHASFQTFPEPFNLNLRKYDILPTVLVKISSHICIINLNLHDEKNSP